MTVKDWYAMLGVAATASPADIAAAVEVMSRRAAAMANTAPERSQQLREDVRAIKRDLLTSAEARRQYDERLRGGGVPRVAPPAVAPPAAEAYPSHAPAFNQPVVPQPFPARAPAGSQPGEPRKRGGRFMQFLQTGWACPSCGEGALPSDKFCPRCGTEITAPSLPLPGRAESTGTCGRCGVAVIPGSRFCTGCGSAVG